MENNNNKEITVNIGSMKVTGTAKDIHKLANIYAIAACDYGQQIAEEIHGKHRNNVIADLKNEQKHLENIEKQLINTIRDTPYYKKYSAEMSAIIDDILSEIE